MAKRKQTTNDASRVLLVVDARTVELYLVGADGTARDTEKFKLESDAEDIDHDKATRDVFDLLYQVALKADSG
jgi:hypothetical protein